MGPVSRLSPERSFSCVFPFGFGVQAGRRFIIIFLQEITGTCAQRVYLRIPGYIRIRNFSVSFPGSDSNLPPDLSSSTTRPAMRLIIPTYPLRLDTRASSVHLAEGFFSPTFPFLFSFFLLLFC